MILLLCTVVVADFVQSDMHTFIHTYTLLSKFDDRRAVTRHSVFGQ